MCQDSSSERAASAFNHWSISPVPWTLLNPTGISIKTALIFQSNLTRSNIFTYSPLIDSIQHLPMWPSFLWTLSATYKVKETLWSPTLGNPVFSSRSSYLLHEQIHCPSQLLPATCSWGDEGVSLLNLWLHMLIAGSPVSVQTSLLHCLYLILSSRLCLLSLY